MMAERNANPPILAHEHIVIRNTEVNDVALIDVDDEGVVTQSRIGRPFKKTNADDSLVDVTQGDTLWIAQSGYGVLAKCVITMAPVFTRILSLEDIETLRRDAAHAGLSDQYWNQERDKFRKRKGRPLYWNAIHFRLVKRLPVSEHFPLVLAKGAQNSWITLTDETRPVVFARRGLPIVTGDDEDLRKYGDITPKVRIQVKQLWGDETAIPRADGESVDYDHWVPKSLGGPGIFAENILPLPSGPNRRKSNTVDIGFHQVAGLAGLLRPEERAMEWKSIPENSEVRTAQEAVVRRVTEQVRKWPVPKQKAFYFAVVERIEPKFRERFVRGGHTPPAPLT